MKSDKYKLLKLLGSIDHFDDLDLEAFLAQYCGEDKEMRRIAERYIGLARNWTHAQFSPEADDESPPTRDFTCGTKYEHYEILRQIGEGGFGEVFLAKQLGSIDRQVALKIMKVTHRSSSSAARIENEVRHLSKMLHLNIARIYATGQTDDGTRFFSMEYVAGLPITQHCWENRLSVKQRLVLFIQACQAMVHAHSHFVVHRDIKPSNVLVRTSDSNVFVIDFGIATIFRQASTTGHQMETMRTRAGTPAYMSPEQLNDANVQLDARTDIYSLGVLLYEVLTGRLPFEFESSASSVLQSPTQMGQVFERAPDKPSRKVVIETTDGEITGHAVPARQLKGDIDAIVMKAISRSPAERYESVAALVDDIHRYLSHLPVKSRRQGTAYRFQKLVRRNWVACLMITILSIAFAVTAFARFSALQEQRRVEALASFQTKMLRDVNARVMGRTIKTKLRTAVESTLLEADWAPEAVRSALLDFDRYVAKVSPVDLAVGIVEEEILLRALDAANNNFHKDELLLASIRHSVAVVYIALGDYTTATRQLEDVVRVRRQLLGDRHEDTLESIGELAAAFQLNSELAKAKKLLTEALVVCRERYGQGNALTLEILNNLGVVLTGMSEYEQARECLEQALTGRRDVLGHLHRHTLSTMNNLGNLFDATGHAEKANTLYVQTLDLRRKAFGPDDIDTLVSLNNLGAYLLDNKMFADAVPYFRDATDGRRKKLGSDHPETLIAKQNLAVALWQTGMFAEASQNFDDILLVREESLGAWHLETLKSYYTRGTLLKELGELDESKLWFQQAQLGFQARFGEAYDLTLKTQRNIDFLNESSVGILRKVLNDRKESLGGSHPTNVFPLRNLATQLMTLGKEAEATEYYEEALQIVESESPGEYWLRARILLEYGRALFVVARCEEAELILCEAMTLFEQLMDTDGFVECVAQLECLWRDENL